MALDAHMHLYSYMYCAPHRDGVLHRMSYLGGFSKLRIGNGGTLGMAKGEDNFGSRVDERLSLSSSRDVP